jgi:glycosyltransferase involved in cell wall biosynthesis
MRYAWDQFEAYFGPDRLGRTGSALARPVMGWLARWDRATANRVDQFVANSRFVAERIGRYYNRRAAVLYPPVDTRFFTPGNVPPESFFLVVSALVPYKRVDVAIAAADRLHVPLKIVGTGPDLARLRARAGPTVQFLGAVDAETLRDLYRRAQAVVLPAEEDFGIAPVESMACGRPVVALNRGGATETVEHEATGWLVDRASPDAFADGMRAVLAHPLDPAELAGRAARFALPRFERDLATLIEDAVAAGPQC